MESEEQKLENFKIGSEVWFSDHYDNLIFGHIIDIDNPERFKVEAGGGTWYVRKSRCHKSREALLSAMQEESDKRVSEMLGSIKSVEDLVRFMYDNTVSCAEEYTDWDARRAANAAAKQLLGIDLK